MGEIPRALGTKRDVSTKYLLSGHTSLLLGNPKGRDTENVGKKGQLFSFCLFNCILICFLLSYYIVNLYSLIAGLLSVEKHESIWIQMEEEKGWEQEGSREGKPQSAFSIWKKKLFSI